MGRIGWISYTSGQYRLTGVPLAAKRGQTNLRQGGVTGSNPRKAERAGPTYARFLVLFLSFVKELLGLSDPC